MSTKHLYDSSDGLVLKSLRGAVALNPSLGLHEPSKTVFVLVPSSSSSPPSHLFSTPVSCASSSDPTTTSSNTTSTTPPTPTRTPRRVAVISGGGSGHEPAHAGYTGKGMLAASVAGDIFASPSAKQVLCAVELAAFSGVRSLSGSRSGGDVDEAPHDGEGEEAEQEPRDVLAIINNYTGDILNFGLAIEKARLLHPSLQIASVVVADDVSLLRQNMDSHSLVGPRGLGANVLVCKVLGALAEYGVSSPLPSSSPEDSEATSTRTTAAASTPGPRTPASLALLKAYGDAVTANLYSLGVGLDHCHVPGRLVASAAAARGDDKARLGEGECEVGLGLHNEPGVHRRPIGRPEDLLEDMVGMLLEAQQLRSGAGMLRGGEEGCVLFVNNLGGMSALEMGAVVCDVLEILAKQNIHPRRIYSSSYMTSLNAPGFSLSLLDATGIRHSLDTLKLEPTSASTTSDTSATSTTTTAQASDSGARRLEQDHLRLQEDLVKINLYDLLDAPTDATSWVGTKRWDLAGASAVAVSERTRRGGEEAKRILELWRASSSTAHGGAHGRAADAAAPGVDAGADAASSPSAGVVEAALRSACTHVLNVQHDLTEFDTLVGDGDCGDTFAAGAGGLLQALDSHTLITQNVDLSKVVSQVADVLEDRMGGTIGALFAIFLNALSAALTTSPTSSSTSSPPTSTSSASTLATPDWPSTLTQALATLSKYTPAQPGDRTIMDALVPFCDGLSTLSNSSGRGRACGSTASALSVEILGEAVRKAREGAERTRGMRARMGRAVYVGSGEDGKKGQLPPDPGALGVAAILEGILEGVRSSEATTLRGS